MNADRFRQIDEILDEILEVSTLEREKLLDARCGTDERLKGEVLDLLDSLKTADDFIETPPAVSVKNILQEETDDYLIGKKIGVYEIVRLLGNGGNGVVYLAKRTDDFEKEVAVKIIPAFENSRRSAENFRRERQILARLEHPNIARILDGGTTPENMPYLVMEYIDGLPLNVFCEKNELSVRERLELFQDVCRAVAFAHQNLVVHRDLKPNNILITGDGKVKLLDFGIAKLLNPDILSSIDNKTLDGSALTPEYASPEQINGENITMASDVYSLGVVLYELLTNRRPFDFRGKHLTEILKMIRREEPAAPSSAAGSKFKSRDAEIDAIVLKSLAKSPRERYQTVEEFRLDIENYLNGLPISARPQTNFYRFGKYVKRHKFESAIGAVLILVLLGWLVTAILQARRAEMQALENRRQAYSAEMILAAEEYENANLNRLREILEKYGPREGEEDLRGFEWYFLNNLLNPSSKIGVLPHEDDVWNVAFSPDGKLLATASNDNFVHLWDISTKQKLASAEQKGAWKIVFFPDSARFAVSSSSRDEPVVRIYETATLKQVLTLKGHNKRVRALDISPDGKTVATAGYDGKLIVWDAASGEEMRKMDLFGDLNAGKTFDLEVYDISFSGRGDKLLVSGFERLMVFDTKNWRRKQANIEDFIERNISLAAWKAIFSPLEQTIVLGMYTGEIVFLDAETLEILRVLKVHQANVKTLAFSADGKILASGSWDRTVKFTDIQTGETVNELRGHFAAIHELAFSPDNAVMATASADLTVNLWDSKRVLDSNSVLTGALLVEISPDGKNAYSWGNVNFDFVRWDLIEKGRKIWTRRINTGALALIYGGKNNRLFFGERDGFVTAFDARDGREIKRSRFFASNIHSMALSPDNQRLFIGDETGTMKAVDAETFEEDLVFKAHSSSIKTIAVSPDGRLLASGSNDKTVKVFEAGTGRELLVLNGNTKPLYQVAFSADGEFVAAGGADDIARIWRVSDGRLVHKFSGMTAGVFALAFSPDGKRLATSSDVGLIRLWNTETGAQVLAFTASSKNINKLKFSDDGNSLMSVDVNGKLSWWKSL
jgi:WD40 repeat protein/serine/threonine protein kinase